MNRKNLGFCSLLGAAGYVVLPSVQVVPERPWRLSWWPGVDSFSPHNLTQIIFHSDLGQEPGTINLRNLAFPACAICGLNARFGFFKIGKVLFFLI